MGEATTEREAWADLPPGLVPSLAAATRGVVAEILPAIREGDPGFADDPNLQEAVRLAVAGFIEAARGGKGEPAAIAAFEQIGREVYARGGTLDGLQLACRTGAHIYWRRVAERGIFEQLEPRVAHRLAAAVYGWPDRLSLAAVSGYDDAAAGDNIERVRQRRRLAELLLFRAEVPEGTLRDVAAAAHWRMPDRACAAVVTRSGGPLGRTLLGEGILEHADGELLWLVIPDGLEDPARRGGLLAALAERRAAIGPTVATRALAGTTELVSAGVELAHDGEAGDGPFLVEDHFADLALRAATEPLRMLASARLAPLANLTPVARDRMILTLQAWLDSQGNGPRIAERLGVHPHTVSYRMRQVRELFGDALSDPDARFELALAIRAEQARIADAG